MIYLAVFIGGSVWTLLVVSIGGWGFWRFIHKPAMRRILTEECEARKAAVAAAEQRARESEGQ